jgi:hypothetical protein
MAKRLAAFRTLGVVKKNVTPGPEATAPTR